MAHLAVFLDFGVYAELCAGWGAGIAVDTMANQLERLFPLEVFLAENIVDVGGGDFRARLVGNALNGSAEFDLQAARQHQAVLVLKQIRYAAFARLTVDAYDRVVTAPQVGWIDGQVGDFPRRVRLPTCKPLFDGVLVRARKCGKDQVAHIGMARVHRQLVAILHAAADLDRKSTRLNYSH